MTLPPPTSAAENTLLPWIAELAEERRTHHLPPGLRDHAERFAKDVLALFFPHLHGSLNPDPRAVADEIERLRGCLLHGLRSLVPERADAVAAHTIDALPRVYGILHEDVLALHDGDPAAESVDEVVLAYPGFFAVALHRVAHLLYQSEVPLLPRLLSEYAHSETGIDIHPGARIGKAFAIDHGTGVVIGETTVIGERVRVFQGVTLGALRAAKSMAQTKRHPTLEDDVCVYANATILGGDTVIGARSIVGGNVWLTRSVAPDSIVTHASEVRLRPDGNGSIEYYI